MQSKEGQKRQAGGREGVVMIKVWLFIVGSKLWSIQNRGTTNRTRIAPSPECRDPVPSRDGLI